MLKSEPPGLTEPRGGPSNDISYMAQDYAKQILEIMNDLRKIKKFCNIVLIVNDAVSCVYIFPTEYIRFQFVFAIKLI